MRELLIAIGALVIVGMAISVAHKMSNECEAKGGVLLKSNFSSVCVKGEVIK